MPGYHRGYKDPIRPEGASLERNKKDSWGIRGGKMKKLINDYKKLTLKEKIFFPLVYVGGLAAYWWISGLLR